ncbi:hypothetical protein [Micromonospora sp. IBHARD004]|uniref:hypothetical protein n=1 Tax=Micromonospora sp. IBHARD004 TaxID=3457764 RepID=UPI00405A1E06
MSEPPGVEPPATVVFEMATARRVGAQLRYAGGPQLAQVRAAVRILTAARLVPPRRT